ncbi:MAG: CDP-alcohol phosphatidyltransferase family protein [Terriglobales bacterium]
MNSQFFTAPNQLTLLRFIFIPFIIICILGNNWRWALALFVLAGVSDGLDGLLARMLKQKTTLGQYLDPIADKLLLSAMFLVLSTIHKIPWKYTVLVFSRDLCIVITAAVLYTVVSMRDFRPSVFGKANTFAQVAAIFFVLYYQINHRNWVFWTRRSLLWLTFALTLISGIHYIFITGQRLRQQQHAKSTSAR